MTLRQGGCPDCDALSSGDCGKHGPRVFGMPALHVGWLCPRCGIVNAPFAWRCQCSAPYIAAGTTTPIEGTTW